MELEDKIRKQEGLIRQALGEWSNERTEEYIRGNEISMDAKMYMSLNSLYLKNRNQFVYPSE